MIYLASYPRSGNTLLRLTLWHVFGLRTSSEYIEEDFRHMRDVIGIDRTSSLRKTHGLWEPERGGGHIYIHRDAQEAHESLYWYWASAQGESNELRSAVRTGAHAFGLAQDHHRSWRQCPGVLWLEFDALMAGDETARIGEFLGVEPTGGEVPSFEELHAMLPYFFRQAGRDESDMAGAGQGQR
jgi:hypothetical protein